MEPRYGARVLSSVAWVVMVVLASLGCTARGAEARG
ncbi:unnamed protein product, partial [uncultured bacterium]